MYFLNRRVILISGKGGVGRTVTASALARAAAKVGRKTLLLEIAYEADVPSALGQTFGHAQLSPELIQAESNLWVGQLWARTGHEEFLASVLPGGPLIRAAIRSRAVEKFLVAAPSMHEMGLFYHFLTLLKATDDAGRPEFDLFVVDMPATGHTLALTGLPEILNRLIPSGPIAQAVKEGQDILNNPSLCEAWVVTLPEQLPVTEACELIEGLQDSKIPIGGVLVNRMPSNPFSSEERAALATFLHTEQDFGAMSLARIDDANQALERLDELADCSIIQLPEIRLPDTPSDALVDSFVSVMVEQS